ncbi:MAG: type II toxin-antitoxin system HicA family toxin [Desulfobacterales bacterium]|nr:type II toxin-antitoxin system HicA family toxin [Desulfobacterales bacterium]
MRYTLLNSRWLLGKLRVFSGKEVCEIFQRHDFIEIRRRGSHILMQRKSSEGTLTIPIPNHQELRIGTLRSIIRQSGISRSEFET